MILNVDVISKIMNEIAPKYFDDDFSEITKNRLGLFGMVSETMATLFENTVVNNAIKARERLTITASRETLLQEAASYPELVIPDATPATITVIIGVPVKYLMSKFMVDSNTIEFTLHKDSIITISNVKFLLPYSVKIIGRKILGKFIYSAQYIIDKENSFSNITNPYLITQTIPINGEMYVQFFTTLIQVEKTYSYYNITETERIPLQGIEFEYENKLAFFNVFYRENSSQSFTLLPKVSYYSNQRLDGNFVYYNTSTPNKIRLYIPSTFNFAFNGELRLDIYTTLGKAGNFTYSTGEIKLLPQSYQDEIDYTGSYFNNIAISNSTGGTDDLTTEEIRQLVINYKSTLRSVDTENDLNQFFANTDKINNMIFIKKRVDIFEKKYTAFMILRNSDTNIISSNTLDTLLTNSDINVYYPQTKRRIIYPYAAYSLTPGQDFQVSKEYSIFSKLKRIRIRLSSNNINSGAHLRELNIKDAASNRIPASEFTFSKGANSDGPINLDPGSISAAFDGNPDTIWPIGDTSVQNDPTKFKEVILTFNTPTFVSSITMGTFNGDVRTYAMGSIEVQYEQEAGTNPDGSDGTWVTLLPPTQFIASAPGDPSGNTYSKDVEIRLLDSVVANLEEDPTKFLFGCPYLIVINEDPPSTSYYLNSIDKEYIMNISYSNEDAPLQFVINKFRLLRNAIAGSNSYTISANLNPVSDLPDGIVDNDGNIINTSAFKVYGLIYSPDNTETILGYFPMNIEYYDKVNKYFRASGQITTDNYITLNDELRFINSIYSVNESVPRDFISPIQNVKFGIAIYYSDGNFSDKGVYSTIIPNMESYGLLNIYVNEFDRASLMINMTRFIQSIITFTPAGSDMNYSIKQVPLIRYSELKNNIGRITEIIQNTNATMSTLLRQIKNNSSIDYKFYATYGKSRYFKMENTDVSLDRLDISMKFRVRVSATKSDTSLVSDLKAFIRPLVEAINTPSISNSIYFSNIITQVENEFKYKQNRILAFELRQINTFSILYQSLINKTPSLETMTKEQLLEFIPEFVRLSVDKIDIDVVYV